jgi:hypothetical protein
MDVLRARGSWELGASGLGVLEELETMSNGLIAGVEL